MENILTAYLYGRRNCPLPSLGSLQFQPSNAKFLPGEKKMLAPVPFIEFSEKEIPVGGLAELTASKKNISVAEAESLLADYCLQIKQMPAYDEWPLGTAGSFYMDENGQLHFKSVAMPAAYFPEVKAERVIHPDVSHQMLVGDTLTNTTAMTELLQEENVVKSKWWIAALVLAAAAIAALFFYYSNHAWGNVGNQATIQPASQLKTP